MSGRVLWCVFLSRFAESLENFPFKTTFKVQESLAFWNQIIKEWGGGLKLLHSTGGIQNSKCLKDRLREIPRSGRAG